MQNVLYSSFYLEIETSSSLQILRRAQYKFCERFARISEGKSAKIRAQAFVAVSFGFTPVWQR